jgi:hypothetical protein
MRAVHGRGRERHVDRSQAAQATATELVLDDAAGAVEPVRQARDVGGVSVADERLPERRAGKGGLDPRPQRVDRAAMLIALSDLRHQPLERVAQMPLSEVELGLGEGGPHGSV